MTSPEQPSVLRLFIALPIPEAVKTEMEKVQRELGKMASGDGLRWTRREQFHLTLKFLGNVPSERTDALLAATRAACQGRKPFALRAGQAGFFPNEHRPRVLWAGIHGETESLHNLQHAIATATTEFAEKQEDREFAAHLTLARIKITRPAEAQALVGRVRSLKNRILGEWTADRVEVIRSELQPNGSRYTCLAVMLLADTR